MVREDGSHASGFLVASLTLVMQLGSCLSCLEVSHAGEGQSVSETSQMKPVDVEEAIKVLQTFERSIRTVYYRAEVQFGFFDDLRDLTKFRPRLPPGKAAENTPPPKTIVEAFFDHERQKFLIRVESHVSNPKSRLPVVHRETFAFDGIEYRGWSQSQGHLEVEIKAPRGIGPIKTDISTAYIDVKRRLTGAEAFFRAASAFYPNEDYPPLPTREGSPPSDPKPLSQWLLEKNKSGELLPVSEIAPGMWRINWVCTPHKPSASKLKKAVVESICNLQSGGWVERKAYHHFYADGLEVPEETIEIKELTESGKWWVPKIRGWIARQPKGSVPAGEELMGQRWVYTEVRINEPIADDVFRPEFPRGTTVRDYVRKLTYVVGEPFEEQEAIRRFMQEQGLAAPPEQQRRWARWWWVGGIGLLVILLGLLLAWRWHWLRRQLGHSNK